jgi:hypothetical protein
MVEHGLLQHGFERGGWRGGREHQTIGTEFRGDFSWMALVKSLVPEVDSALVLCYPNGRFRSRQVHCVCTPESVRAPDQHDPEKLQTFRTRSCDRTNA